MMKYKKIISLLCTALILFCSCKETGKEKNNMEFMSIELDATNVKATYSEGEKFDADGLIVYAVYSDGSKAPIQNYTVETKMALKKGSQTITISATINDVTKYAELPVMVNGQKFMYYTTEKGTMLAPAYDVWLIGTSRYDYTKLRSEIKAFKDMGFTRIYFIVLNPGYPFFSGGSSAPYLGSPLLGSIAEFNGDINAAVAKVCREYNMEAIAVYKPYENGGLLTVPHGATIKEEGYREETVGGISMFYDEFASKHPEMKIARKDDYDEDDYKLPITKIELDFLIDQYATKAASFSKITDVRTPPINLWVSKDNGEYKLYEGKYSYDYRIESRTIYDPTGLLLAENRSCNVLTITNINIGEEYPYVAVTLNSATNMRLIPYSMIHWYSGNKELKLTASTYVRILNGNLSYMGQWTNQALPSYSNMHLTSLVVNPDGTVTGGMGGSPTTSKIEDIARFYKTGFVFSWKGDGGNNGEGWKGTAILGLARGKSKYMGGSLCEAYEEVREYWLQTVKHLLDVGFSGVDIRLQNHSSMILDYTSYGFNEPIVEKYKELYGVDITKVPMTEEIYLNIMKVRGDFFMLFLEDAEKLIHERGATLIIHLKDADETPACDASWVRLCNWTMPKISLDWRRCVELADEITIKDFYNKNYSTKSASEIKDYAVSLGKRVWEHWHYTQGDGMDDNFIQAIENDDRVDGMIIYDYFGNFNEDIGKMLQKYNFADRNN